MSETATPTTASEDHIVFLGDSLAQSGQRPDGFINLLGQSFAAASESKSTESWLNFDKVNFVSAGAQRDKIAAGLDHLEKMGSVLKPKALVLMLGLYDVWQQDRLAGGIDWEKTGEQLRELLSQACNLRTDQDQPIRVYLCTPMLVGEKPVGENSLDQDLAKISEVICNVSAEFDSCKVVDLRKAAVEYLKENNPNGRPHSILTIDGVHLNHNGHRLVAAQFAREFGIDLPQPVERQLRHIVLLKFAQKTPHSDILALVEKFKNLDRLIPGIDSIEAGENVSPEGKTKGFTHGFTLTFASSSQRDAYLQDSNHRQFSAEVRRIAEDVLVFDYWATNNG